MNYTHIGQLVETQLRTKDIAMIYKHIDGVEVNATFSECMQFRYRLDVVLKTKIEGKIKTVCAIMQNPSVADSEIADKSLQFLEKLIFMKNIPEFADATKLIIINQFAFVQTNKFSGQAEHIGPENDRYIQDAIAEADVILVAWGSSNSYSDRQNFINDKLIKCQPNKVLLEGKQHPSRASYDDYVSTYDISPFTQANP
jgi:hypothetical protein